MQPCEGWMNGCKEFHRFLEGGSNLSHVFPFDACNCVSNMQGSRPTSLFGLQDGRNRKESSNSKAIEAAMEMNVLVCIGVLLPFPFYYWLWKFPQSWVDLCGKDTDPCHRMAQISHLIKILQFLALLSVAHFCWPPWYFWVLFSVGQFLNFKVYHLLGESGTYYGIRFGKNIPWVTEFPFGYIQDPQYVGSILSLVGCLCWFPYQYLLLWVLGCVFMMVLESKEDLTTRARPCS